MLVAPRGERRRSRGLAQACLFGACAAALLGSASPPPARAVAVAPLPAAAAAALAIAPAPPPLPQPAPDERLIPAPAPSAPVARSVTPPSAPQPTPSGGALRILVSIAEQKAYVFRGSALVASSPVSTGKRGHATPTGTFPITQKKVRHFSNLYDNAPMPYMQRLAQSAVALHAGHVPGYPASHGCIRLPRAFARKLYAMTDHGTRVTVVRGGAGLSKKRKKSGK